MISIALFLALAFSFGGLAIDECCNASHYLRLPSAKKIDAVWDYYEEVGA